MLGKVLRKIEAKTVCMRDSKHQKVGKYVSLSIGKLL